MTSSTPRMRSSRVFVIATLARGGAREVELGCNSVVGDEMTKTRNRLRRQRDGKESTAHHSAKESRRLGYSHWRAERRTLDDFTTQSPTEGHVRPLGRSRWDPSLVRVRSVCSELTPAAFGRRAIGSDVRLLGHGRLSGDFEVGAIDARAVSRLGLGRSPPSRHVSSSRRSCSLPSCLALSGQEGDVRELVGSIQCWDDRSSKRTTTYHAGILGYV